MIDKKVIGIIPARYKSTRLPGKPLADLHGKPVICHVWNAARSAENLHKVIVATDDTRIADTCKQFGASSIMTAENINSGTDRIIQAFNSLNEHFDYIVNIQGDEPFITPELIDKLIEQTLMSSADVGTLITKVNNYDELFDKNIVKVVLRQDNTALYFSRSPIPFYRDCPPTKWLSKTNYYKHIGIYAYSHQALLKFAYLERSELEIAEQLEQLRLLQAGAKYICIETDTDLISIDTPEDLERAKELMNNKL